MKGGTAVKEEDGLAMNGMGTIVYPYLKNIKKNNNW